jgi:multidrug efflux pump subunit AcrA (membrane-fusion protein)
MNGTQTRHRRRPGTTKNKICGLRWLLVAALLISACRSASSVSEKGAAEPAVIMAVSGARATVKPMRSELRLLGQTQARRHIILRAPAAGRLIGLNILIGDHLRRGQVVAHIISREVEAVLNGLAVARQIDPAEASGLASSVKRYTVAAGVPVTVPETSIVAQRIVSSGQLVADYDQLADLIDPRSVFVNTEVPVEDLAAIRPGMQAVVNSSLYPGVDFPARVASLSPSFNQTGATSPALIEFTGSKRIYQADAPVEATVTIKIVPEAIVIPETALFEDAATDSYYVFVAGNDLVAHRQTVTVGIRNQSDVQIISGVQPGQVVITSGGYALSDGLKLNVDLRPN